MKKVIGLILCVAGVGVGVGIYFGVWWAFIGGITQVINQIQAEHIVAVEVAKGIARVLCAGVIGGASALVLIAPGVAILKD